MPFTDNGPPYSMIVIYNSNTVHTVFLFNLLVFLHVWVTKNVWTIVDFANSDNKYKIQTIYYIVLL